MCEDTFREDPEWFFVWGFERYFEDWEEFWVDYFTVKVTGYGCIWVNYLLKDGIDFGEDSFGSKQ